MHKDSWELVSEPLLKLQEDVVLAPSEHLRHDLARVMLNRVPQPARVRFALHVAPHVVQLCGASPTAIQFLSAADLHLDLRGMQNLYQGLGHGLEHRRLFFHAGITGLVRTCNTRAVSRIPLACRAIATLGSLTAGDCPG